MKRIALLTLIAVFATAGLFAQEKAAKELKSKNDLKEIENGWTVTSSLGLDLKQVVFINPRASAGQTELGFGGLTTLSATYVKDKFAWDNFAGLQLGFTRFGKKDNFAGNPFQKTNDLLRIASKPAYALTDDYKWYTALEMAFESQVLPAYKVDDKVLLEGPDESLVSNFMVPGIIGITPGIDWKPNDNFSLLMSPAAMRIIVVADKDLAATKTLGNPSGETVEFQLGASAKGTYENKFLKDRILFKTSLSLFYNYLGEHTPTQVRATDKRNLPVVQWLTALDVKIIDGLTIGVATALDYDFNIKVNQDWDPGEAPSASNPAGVEAGYRDQGGPGAQFMEHFYVKYTKTLTTKKE